MAAGLPGMERGDQLELGPSYAAAALWLRHGYGRALALPQDAAAKPRDEGQGDAMTCAHVSWHGQPTPRRNT